MSKPKKFKFSEWVFNHCFPFYYKEYDTYKNEDGEGLLERFINICSQYLDEDIVPDIDNILDIIDASIQNKEELLKHLWEDLGGLPFSFLPHNLANTRELIRYTISLYRIKGTNLFYQTIFKLMGAKNFIIKDKTYGEGQVIDERYSRRIVSGYTENPKDPFEEMVVRFYGSSDATGITAYYGQACLSCIDITITVEFDKNNTPDKKLLYQAITKILPVELNLDINDLLIIQS